jgi:hypothetical protein
VLAEKLVREFPEDDVQRAQCACRTLLGKQVPGETCDILVRLLRDEREHFKTVPEEAELLRSKNGEAPADKSLDAAEVAATTLLVRGLLGFDECVMK